MIEAYTGKAPYATGHQDEYLPAASSANPASTSRRQKRTVNG